MVDPIELVKNRKSLIEEMTDKYGYIFCQRCKKSKTNYKFEVHHIMFRSRFPKHPLLHSKINLIVLCSKCHELVHRNNSENELLIAQRNLKELFYK
jgi:predicted HNH restriction endonuclease